MKIKGMLGSNPPINAAANQLEAGRVTVPGQSSGYRYRLYDTAVVLAATVATYDLFQTPKGQGAKTILDTNMQVSGMLPAGWSFSCMGLSCYVAPTGANSASRALDAELLTNGGALVLTVNNKEVFSSAPLGTLPAAAGLEGALGGTNAVLIGAIQPRGPELEFLPFTIAPGMNFAASLVIPSVALSASVRYTVALEGLLFRPVS